MNGIAVSILLLTVFAIPTSAQSILFSQDAGMVMNQVTPDQTQQFEAAIATIRNALTTSANPAHRELVRTWKVYRAAEPMGGNALYVFVMDRAVSGADYSIRALATAVLSKEDAEQAVRQIAGSLAAGQNMLNLGTVFGPRAPAPSTASETVIPRVMEENRRRVADNIIRTKCATDWPDDFRMRAHCESQQAEALAALTARSMSTTDRRTIRRKCATDWPGDYRMQNHCEEQQLKALTELR